jgi:hypothetical protein
MQYCGIDCGVTPEYSLKAPDDRQHVTGSPNYLIPIQEKLMSNSPQNETMPGLKSLYTIGGIAAILQLVAILAYSVALGILGPTTTSAQEYFIIQQSSKLEAVLRGNFLLLILIGLYLGTFPALYVALRRYSPIYTALATLFTLITVTMTFGGEATFALLHLGDKYAATADQAVQSQLVAAGEAVLAAGMWNSTAAYMSGILLQGSGVMISVIMLRNKDFNKITAWAGILGNAFDLIQHVIHPFAPAISTPIQMFMGIFYFVWFPMLGWDLIKLGRKENNEQSH